MVQIGDYHIGRADTAEKPVLDCGEAFFLWDQLVARYHIIDLTQRYQDLAHDPDFKMIISKGLTDVLEKQVNVLEDEMNKHSLPLPPRPPKSVHALGARTLIDDRFIFGVVFSGIQGFLDSHIRAVRSMVTNDALRAILIRFAKEELDLFAKLCKYGKVKGWLEQPPLFKLQ